MSYKVADLVERLQVSEVEVRKMLKKAGLKGYEGMHDPDQPISDDEFEKLVISMAMKKEGSIIGNMWRDMNNGSN